MIVTPQKYAEELTKFVTRPNLEEIPILNSTNSQVDASFAQYIDGAVCMIVDALQKSTNAKEQMQNTLISLQEYTDKRQTDKSLDDALSFLLPRLKTFKHEIEVQWHPFLQHLCALMDDYGNFKDLGPFVLHNAMQELVKRANNMSASPTLVNLYIKLDDLSKTSKLRQHVSDISKISPKLQALVERLQKQKTFDKGKVMVFVQTRRMANHLKQYFDQTKFYLRAGVLVGHAKSSDCADDRGMGHKDQRAQMQQFNGDGFDLLITTSVAEEGLDVQKCNLVVRFDTTNSLTAIIQSRGRARDSKGEFCAIYGNVSAQMKKLKEIAISEENMQKVIASFNFEVYAQLKRRRGEDLSFDALYASVTNRAQSDSSSADDQSFASFSSTSARTPTRSPGVNYRQQLEQYFQQRGMQVPTLEPPKEATSPFSAYVKVLVPGASSPKCFEGQGHNKKDAKNNAYYEAWLAFSNGDSTMAAGSASVIDCAASASTAPSSPSTPVRTPTRTPGVNYRQQLEQYCRSQGMQVPTLEPPKEATSPFSACVTVFPRGSSDPVPFVGIAPRKKDAKNIAYYNAWVGTNTMFCLCKS